MSTAPTLGSVNLEASDPHVLAAFYADLTGGTPQRNGDLVYLPAPGGFALFFQPLSGERPGRALIHLDLTVPWGERTPTVERLVGAGARHLWDVLDEQPHVQWSTLADPEGNPFCIAEHPPR